MVISGEWIYISWTQISTLFLIPDDVCWPHPVLHKICHFLFRVVGSSTSYIFRQISWLRKENERSATSDEGLRGYDERTLDLHFCGPSGLLDLDPLLQRERGGLHSLSLLLGLFDFFSSWGHVESGSSASFGLGFLFGELNHDPHEYPELSSPLERNKRKRLAIPRTNTGCDLWH